MMASRVTPPATEVEGTEEDGEEDGGAVGVAGSVVLMRGHFN